ncbi:hypothetical protein [Seonamhaeicola marinus]|uniref:Cellobiose phosphorylase n=1 Tax=Seonamhaeicola marinus TaxID=1912246 RepID=A0A5D0IL86_9FLAO|nr:hypothetical protein [Seonamhaeicola marinus]TYA84324.1 hypothetical protein FUA24_06670 [Seonamhaeicola marinus]
MTTTFFTNDSKVLNNMKKINGNLVTLKNETYYKISNCDNMRPFLMSIVSDSNHWMFISSNGGLSAGRKNAEYSLFPYYTDDKLTEMAEITGSKTLLRVHKNGDSMLWEPFSIRQSGVYETQTNLYKNTLGNKVVFEQVNLDLKLTFRYEWNSSDRFGFVKKSTLINNDNSQIEVNILDGLQNILPANVTSDLQNSRSNLVDAYKRSELQVENGLGIYALSAVIVDKAEPSEALKANTVWSYGLENPTYLLSSLQLDRFRSGRDIEQEEDIKAEKGGYFINSKFLLDNNKSNSWAIVANVNQSISNIVELSKYIGINQNIETLVEKDIELGSKKLKELVGAADGLQLSKDPLVNMRHFSNTLFNVMRGGIFDDGYTVEKADFTKYIAKANKAVYQDKLSILQNLEDTFSLNDIKNIAESDGNPDFKRLCFEYLPLKFSRRHGDPSRPWNKFSINTKSEVDGSKVLDYEGNWRDIFQNWEALAYAYPDFIESMIHKFLNASTFEGYNPYRVTKDGFDWEVIEEHDPWSYIGYWGDHQIIYLLKFLEIIENFYPGQLEKRFNQDVFVYANVPYVIKDYKSILQNPKDTIDFNHKLDHQINERRNAIGADGALLQDENSNIHRVNFIEKILATVLSKISNFIPEAGIWLNTQRPEWNDANNALVGNGVSMVTLYYIYRFLNFFETIVGKSSINQIQVSQELKVFFDEVLETLQQHEVILVERISNTDRKSVMDGLGSAGSKYRETIYNQAFSGIKEDLKLKDISTFIEVTKSFLKQSIDVNKRKDNMYHAYNLMTVESDNAVSVSYLAEMLEGQVAALSAGYLSPEQVLEVLDAMKASALFRDDQYSYILYPNKNLSGFAERNNIPSAKVKQSKLLKKLIIDGNTQVIEEDIEGGYHFNSNFNNANSLELALNNLNEDYKTLIEAEKEQVLQIFEDVFDHKSFTGRSGTFFGYEGLGSIYWHMVSKLLLAVQENCWSAINSKADPKIIGRLLDHYYEINAGIGVHKSPELYGAFPTDPYSHTPETKGAQQPGMTGQVKEDILCRFGELGVFVEEGKLTFKSNLLQSKEFIKADAVFNFTNVNGEKEEVLLKENELVFTVCQVPFIYKLSDKTQIQVHFYNGKTLVFETSQIDWITSQSIFNRQGEVNKIIVAIKK